MCEEQCCEYQEARFHKVGFDVPVINVLFAAAVTADLLIIKNTVFYLKGQLKANVIRYL
jgi:hypothetical protein